MRVVTSSLLAAQRLATQLPRVRVLVRDKQVRVADLAFYDTINAQAAACVFGTSVLAVALDAAGGVWVRVVTDPTAGDPLAGGELVGWGHWQEGWTQIVAGALAWPNGDVAVSNNSGTLRVFYVAGGGASILCVESADGVSWGAPVTVKSVAGGGATYLYKLASAGQNDVLWCFSRSGYRYVYYRRYAGGAWGTEKCLTSITETGGEFNNCGGLSVARSTDAWSSDDANVDLFVAAAFWGDNVDNAVDGRIVTCWWRPAESDVTGVSRIVPPGLATLGFTPLWPCLTRVPALLGSRWILTYTDKFSGSGASWSYPVAIWSADGVHWSYKVPLATVVSYEPRVCVVVASSVVYVWSVHEVSRLDLWYAGKADYEYTAGQAGVLAVLLTERPGYGRLSVDVDNRLGTWDDPGQSGSGVPALRPLAQVIVEVGLRTAVGDERVELRPMLLWSSVRLRRPGVNAGRLNCVDGWELFKLWRPDATYVFASKSVGWCIAELASRVGGFAVTTDGNAAWNATLSYFAVAAEHSDWSGRHQIRALGRWVGYWDPVVALDSKVDGWTALQALLGLVGGMARWGNGADQETLYCWIPSAQGESPAPVHVYGEGEVLEGEYVDGFAWPTRVRATGAPVMYEGSPVKSGATWEYEGQDVANGQETGMEFMGLLYSGQWESAAACQVAAEGALDDAEARRWGGWIETLPNAGVELMDVVTFSDALAGAGMVLVKRRVNGVRTEFEVAGWRGRAKKASWRQRLWLEGV